MKVTGASDCDVKHQNIHPVQIHAARSHAHACALSYRHTVTVHFTKMAKGASAWGHHYAYWASVINVTGSGFL
jgi:hypothetical protein